MKTFWRTFTFFLLPGVLAGAINVFVWRWLHLEDFFSNVLVATAVTLLCLAILGLFRKYVLQKPFVPPMR